MKIKFIFLLTGLVFGAISATDCYAQKTGSKDRINAPSNQTRLNTKHKIAYTGPVIGDPNTNESYKSPNINYVQTARSADLCNNKYADNSIRKGTNHIRFFQIKNIGTEPLEIKEATTSCGCVKVKFSKAPIKPGGTTSIEVDYDTNRVGPFQKAITLTTNMHEPTFKLLISGTVSDCQ